MENTKNIPETEQAIWVIFGKLQELGIDDVEEDKLTDLIARYKTDDSYSDKQALEDAQAILVEAEAQIIL